jgi:hypothetical protein
MKKLLCIVIFVLMTAAPALAAQPEFDAVGCDKMNIFAMDNNLQFGAVITNNVGPNGPINEYSDFDWEGFSQTAGQLFPDPCFPGLDSALTDQHNSASYTWYIVLQMKPQTDIDLKIFDCVLTRDMTNIFGSADQTGRVRDWFGNLIFLPEANPRVTVVAYAGEFATEGFPSGGLIMDARAMPTLRRVALNEKLYTSKAHWDETLVMVLPKTGRINMSRQTEVDLKQGDKLKITVDIPGNNTVDIRYGEDSVLVEYVGIEGTWYYDSSKCP